MARTPKTPPKTPPNTPPAKTTPDSSTHTNIAGESVPRMPHERDESSDSGTSEPREIIRKAHDDVESGKVDTDRGEVTNEVYNKNLREPKARTPKP